MNGTAQLILLEIFYWSGGVVFTHSMKKREDFGKRAGFCTVWILFLMIAGFFVQTRWPVGRNVMRCIGCVSMAVILYVCWDISRSVAIYNGIWALSFWQITSEFWKAERELLWQWIPQNPQMDCLNMILLFTVSYIVCAQTVGRWMPVDRKKHIGPRQLFSAILIFFMIEILAFLPALRNPKMDDMNSAFLYLSQIICIFILYLQNELFKKSEIKQELALMNLLLKKEQEQYQLSKENIALINQKCHDLKHQIRALRKVRVEEYDQYLNEVEDHVRIYESMIQTGNEVFDTILTEKSLYCKDRGIRVSCVADGSQMDFINTVDLYSILGNAMDNAIEAVEKFEELEKRQIDVMIYREQNFLIMNFINPIPERLQFQEDFPVTTKGDKNLHGFGLRSIRYIVKQYDGYVNISDADGCFSLKILIPIVSS